VAGQLKKLAITGSRQKDRMFLGVDVGRVGYVDKGNLRDVCVKHQLPCDDDIVDSVRTVSFPNPSTTARVGTKVTMDLEGSARNSCNSWPLYAH